ncbi:MAG: hypothetical protein E7003_03245 [Eggerthellaceae bacterium]|nr:hypothetical protein [Eggerthellaceae bacterium]MBQ6455208.1 hypothetical protein [Eggerthellaceae bacterium]
MAKKKKKMTPAQAAAARRPDDWESPQSNQKPSKAGAKATKDVVTDKGNRRTFVIFAVIFIVAAIAAPFIVIYASRLFGIQ